ncbi:hypothetical protein AB996_1147 [Lactococcus cremoris]|uniref:Uncharacterized protein n=1 Tax=Lactococcus lactis subsp. cremoris TaxID=1359 RepID=A0A166JU63_LACLC|nr:hypothetical protein [Lactococcus cremoris]KZK06651.1 hypothetical protein AB996_1147 [Lactococcus cremoris]
MFLLSLDNKLLLVLLTEIFYLLKILSVTFLIIVNDGIVSSADNPFIFQ